jgi:nucleotide-binding universal stress UspA family protein
MFNKIMAATARPLECDEIVLTAGQIAFDSNAKLLILHVLESASSDCFKHVEHYRTGDEVAGDENYFYEVRQEIYKNCSKNLAPIDKLEIHTALGISWVEIVKWAEKEKVDLTVLGAHIAKTVPDEEGIAGPTVGSTADGVIRHLRCPVMIVGHSIPKSGAVFERVMVCVDFSPSCISAFQFGLALAQRRDSKLYLFHMLPVPPQPQYSQAKYEAEVRQIHQRLEEDYLSEIPDTIEAKIDAWGGAYPDIEILKFARQNGIDLIVMGSHTKTKERLEESRWYVGSAVERASTGSDCPVVVVTDEEAVEKWKG